MQVDLRAATKVCATKVGSNEDSEYSEYSEYSGVDSEYSVAGRFPGGCLAEKVARAPRPPYPHPPRACRPRPRACSRKFLERRRGTASGMRTDAYR